MNVTSGRPAGQTPTSISAPAAAGLASWAPDHPDLMILGNIAEGRTVESIARRLSLSERTVRRRLRGIADDIGVDSTIEAVVHAVRRGLI